MTFLQIIDREGRFGEWQSSLAYVFAALLFMLDPGSIMRFAAFQTWYDLGITEELLTGLFMAIGVLSVIVLVINGHWHRSPELRGMLAGARALVLFALALLIVWGRIQGDVTSLPVVLPFMLANIIADARGVYRAGEDHRHAHIAA